MTTPSLAIEQQEDFSEILVYALCECILCLYAPDQPSAWWRLLPDAAELFAPEGRIREVPLDRCRAEVERAVAEGFRPILFVPRPADWPMVYDQLGHYQGFAQLCVRGRDDALMQQLLQGPSPEVQAIIQGEGHILVPDLDYAKALDERHTTSLDDLSRVETGSPQEQGAFFVSRLNPFRFLSVGFDERTLEFQLQQFYRHRAKAGEVEQISCEQPLLFSGVPLRFPGGQCELTHSTATKGGLGSVITSLGRMAQGRFDRYLSRAQQLLLSLWLQLRERSEGMLLPPPVMRTHGAVRPPKPAGSKVVEELLRRVREAAIEIEFAPPAALRTRGLIKTRGAVPTAAKPPGLPLLITDVCCSAQGLELVLRWTAGKSPPDLKEVVLSIDGKTIVTCNQAEQPPADGVQWELTADGGRLRLIGYRPQSIPEIAWAWDAEPAPGRLRLYIRETPPSPG